MRALVTDLTASIPRDVIIGAQQQWLPNLGTEMANRPVAGSALPQARSGSDARQARPSQQDLSGEVPQSKGATGKADAAKAKPDASKETLSAERIAFGACGLKIGRIGISRETLWFG